MKALRSLMDDPANSVT